jgi:hypothetical protein
MKIEEMADDFGVFLQIVFPYIGLTPHPCQLHFADFIAGPGERKLAMSQRDMGKSNLLSLLVVWYGYCNPDCKIIVASATEKRAKDIVRQAKAIIKSCDLLSHMAPGKDDLDGELRFNFGNRSIKGAKDPSVAAYGMNAGMTGAHADIIIADDLEIPENSMTREAREKIRERVRGFESLINDGDHCKIIMVGTPQTMESMYFELIEDAIYDLYRVPARVPLNLDDSNTLGFPGWIRDGIESGVLKPGDTTYPERFPLEELAKREARMGHSMFMLQFLLDPSVSDSDKFPLKLSDFIVQEIGLQEGPPRVVWGTSEPRRDIRSPGLGVDQFYSPIFFTNPRDWIPYEHGVMWIDPAGGGDEVGYAVVKALGGNAYVLRAGGKKGGYSDKTLHELLTIAQECGIRRITVEKNWGDGLYGQQLTNKIHLLGLKMSVDSVSVKGQKEIRIIETLEPLMNAHRIVIDPMVARDYELMYQISHISRERGCLPQDDRVDALAGAVSCLQSYLFRDSESAIKDYEEREFQETLRECMNLIKGPQKPQPKRFISLRKRR